MHFLTQTHTHTQAQPLVTNKMASGRLTGTPKIHFRALKCKSNLALKRHSTDFFPFASRAHENLADEGYWMYVLRTYSPSLRHRHRPRKATPI